MAEPPPNEPELLWIEHTGNIYRGYFHDCPIRAWNCAAHRWADIPAVPRGPDWGNVITEDEARGYMV